MEHVYKNTTVFYDFFGEGKRLLVFLHGWGASGQLMLPIANKLSFLTNSSDNEKTSYLLIDFPPFGKSGEPKAPWNLDDYVNLTREVIDIVKKQNKIENIYIISHSFGGRVALKLLGTHLYNHNYYSNLNGVSNSIDSNNNNNNNNNINSKSNNYDSSGSNNDDNNENYGNDEKANEKTDKNINDDIDKLVLISSAGIKPRFSLRVKFKVWKYKFYKKIGSRKAEKCGSRDYKILSPIMKATFNNIIREDLTKICPNINTKTLIIFGDKDRETPLYMGKKLRKLIPNSRLIVIKGGDHFSYIYYLKSIIPSIHFFLFFG